MADEQKEKDSLPIEQRIEVESQQAASADHQKEEAAKVVGDILREPEKADRATPAGDTGSNIVQMQPDPALVGHTHQPEKGKEVEPVKSAIAFPSGDFNKKTACPECGRAGWKSEQALKAHIRFAHELPKKKAEALKNGGPAPDPDHIPAPDFSDIPGEQNRISPAVEPSIASKRYETMANMTFDMSTGILARIFGPEWNPSSVDERAAVVIAIQKYYESVELPDIPPGYMLCFVCAAYAAPRLAQQPTRTKLQAAWLWLKLKFSRRRPA